MQKVDEDTSKLRNDATTSATRVTASAIGVATRSSDTYISGDCGIAALATDICGFFANNNKSSQD